MRASASAPFRRRIQSLWMRERASRRPPRARLLSTSGDRQRQYEKLGVGWGVGGQLNALYVTVAAWLVIGLRLMGEN